MEWLLAELRSASRTLADVAADIETGATRIWAQPQAPWFTDHTTSHSRRIGSSIEQILHGTTLPNFSPLSREELLVLIGACYLHDVGMQMTRVMTPALGEGISAGDAGYRSAYDELIRPAHPYIIHEIISSPSRPTDPALLGLVRCPRDLQVAIAEVSLSHGRWGYLTELRGRPGGIRLDLLGALLQIGDVFDIARERINWALADWIDLPITSRAHWALSSCVSSVFIDSRSLAVKVSYSMPPSTYWDAILVHRVRQAVERKWLGAYASEALDHLAEHYGISIELPLLGDEDFRLVREPVSITDDESRNIDVNTLRTYEGELAPEPDDDIDRLKSGRWPRSATFRGVIAALVRHCSFGAGQPDSDVAIAHRCGIQTARVQLTCARLRSAEILVLSSRPVLSSAGGTFVTEYEIDCSGIAPWAEGS